MYMYVHIVIHGLNAYNILLKTKRPIKLQYFFLPFSLALMSGNRFFTFVEYTMECSQMYGARHHGAVVYDSLWYYFEL